MGLWFYPYWFYCLVKFGLTDSISATWYEHKNWIGRTWFTFTLIGLATPLFWFIPEDHPWEFLVFIGVGGIWLTGVAAAYKKEYVEKYHVYGSIVGIVVALVAVWVVLGFFQPLLITAIITAFMHGLKVKGATNFIEAASFITIWWYIHPW